MPMNNVSFDQIFAERATPKIKSKVDTEAVQNEASNTFEKMFTSVRGAMENADKASVQALVGQKAPHDAMLAMTKADIAFRFMAQTRNKAFEAYQQIMNMQM